MTDPATAITAGQAALAAAAAAPPIGAYALRNRLKELIGNPPGRVFLGREIETRGGPKRTAKRERRDYRQLGPIALYREQARLALFAKSIGLDLADLVTHLQIVGPTNQGKTQMMLTIAEQLLREGVGVLVHETGGDFGRKLVAYAEAHGRPVFVFDPVDKTAWKLNLIGGRGLAGAYSVAERAAATLEAVGSSSEDFFKTHNANMLRAVIMAAHAYAAVHGGVPTLDLAKKIANDHETRVDALGLKRRGSANGKDDNRYTVNNPFLKDDQAAREFWELEYYGSWGKQERDTFAQGMKGALNTILGNPAINAAVCPTLEDKVFDLSEAIEAGGLVILRCTPGSIGDESDVGVKTARALSVWFLQLIQQTVLKRDPEAAYPLIAFFDEVHNTLGRHQESAAEDFSHWIAMARHYNVGCVFAYQGYEMIPYALKVTFSINLRNKLVCGGLDYEDAAYVQRQLGDDAASVTSTRRTKEGLLPDAGSVSTTTTDEERYRFAIDEIRHLPWGYWIFTGTVRGQLLYPTLMKVPLPPTLEDIRLRREKERDRAYRLRERAAARAHRRPKRAAHRSPGRPRRDGTPPGEGEGR